MQTFLPYADFVRSMQVLDYRRLGKQRVEAAQLIRTLEGGQIGGWARHPAARMWAGYEPALKLYHNHAILEWVARGYNNTMPMIFLCNRTAMRFPSWLNDHAFHASHRSNLLRKDPDYYGKYDWIEGPDLPYVWPVRK